MVNIKIYKVEIINEKEVIIDYQLLDNAGNIVDNISRRLPIILAQITNEIDGEIIKSENTDYTLFKSMIINAEKLVKNLYSENIEV